jgi:hypothetical protein
MCCGLEQILPVCTVELSSCASSCLLPTATKR